MDIAFEKQHLIKLIEETEDESLLLELKMLLERNATISNIDEMPKEVKEALAVSIAQSENGETIAHEDVMANYAKWLKK